MNTERLALAAASLVLVSCLGGCSAKALTPVSGSVTVDGRALDRGSVTFHPVKGGPLGIGKIQPDGKYTIETAGQRGVAPGEYLVTVVATGEAPKPTARGPEAPPPLLVAARYGRTESSGLRVTVSGPAGKYELAVQSR
jgi:hypothetical protein